jgi:multidrug efflux system membrane fusion protein
MSRKFLTTVAIAALIGGGVLVYQHSTGGIASAQMGGEMPAMPVPVLDVSEKPVQIWKQFSGKLMAVDYVEIRPQVSGIIQKVHFQDGQIVKKGDVLFSIDPRPYEAAAAQARADIAAAKENTEYAEKELQRAEELLQTGAISRQGYDQRVNAARTNKSAGAAANARLKAALVDLDHTTIEAPVSGRISRPEITEGNLVKADNAPLLATIVSDQGIYADFDVDEQTYLSFVRRSTGSSVESEKEIPVKLTLQGDDMVYQGTIKSFDNKINPSSGTIRARAMFNNDDGALLPGMFANVQIGSTGKENVIAVPEKAVLTDQSRKFVYVAQDGAATYREVKLGETLNGERIILSGLKPGDRVVIDGLMKLRPGAKIQPMTPQEMEAMKAQMAAQQQGGNTPPKEGAAKPEEKPEDKSAEPSEQPAAEQPAAEKTEPEAIPFEEPAVSVEDAPETKEPAKQDAAKE